MDKIGVGALADTGLVAALGERMRTHTPVLIISHDDDSRVTLQSAKFEGPETIELPCT